MRERLTEWAKRNVTNEQLLVYDATWSQVRHVKDQLPRRLFPTWEASKLFPVMVVATHTSKGQLLPVYELKAPGIKAIMRGNFHDWKVSLWSDTPINIDFVDLLDPNHEVAEFNCEGFEKEWILPSYASNHSQFTVALYSQPDLDIFFWLIGTYLNLRQK